MCGIQHEDGNDNKKGKIKSTKEMNVMGTT